MATEESNQEVLHVIVIGAGLAGLVAAKRYLDAAPTASMAILEKGDSVGGVFSRQQLYPGFHTQWTVGLSEFFDKTMSRPPKDDCIGDCYKARYTMEYLEEYTAKVMHDGSTLKNRIAFGMHVRNVEKVDGLWHVICSDRQKNTVHYKAKKLMIATGEHSHPNIPPFVGQNNFASPIIHSADFGSSNILSTSNIQHITVLGAGKSAADMLYEAVKAGKAVDWIIRESGAGPGFFVPADLPSPYSNP